MTRKRDIRTDSGFTLIELLVVILIIGILAAIAIPAFLGQRAKAQDSTAKSNARNMVSQIEACFHAVGGYVGCTAELTTASTGLDIGPGPGQVRIVSETATGWEISATSQADSGGTNHVFTIVHNLGGVFDHDCTVLGEGGCPTDGDW
jgi:type IV pilus assembly protein PilA